MQQNQRDRQASAITYCLGVIRCAIEDLEENYYIPEDLDVDWEYLTCAAGRFEKRLKNGWCHKKEPNNHPPKRKTKLPNNK